MRNLTLLLCFVFSCILAANAEIDESKVLSIPEGTTEIKSGSYKNKTDFKYIQFPSSLKKIGSSAFCGCDSLESVILPKGVFVGSEAFQSCKNLKSVILEDNVKIDERAFRYCKAVDTIQLAENDSLGYGVFEDITPVRNIVIPKSTFVDMWGIPSDTTYYTGTIEDIFNTLTFFYKGTVLYVNNEKMGNNLVIPDYVTEISYKMICALKEVFSTITINPQTLRKIENECEVDTVNYLGTLEQYNAQPIRAKVVLFNGKQLGGVVPEGVDSLGGYASEQLLYDDTRKNKIVLPSSLKYIRQVVSYKDTVLNIISFAEQPPVLESDYYLKKADVRLYVPCQSVWAYQNDAKWGAAKSIKCLHDTVEIVEPVIPVDTVSVDTTVIEPVIPVDTVSVDTTVIEPVIPVDTMSVDTTVIEPVIPVDTMSVDTTVCVHVEKNGVCLLCGIPYHQFENCYCVNCGAKDSLCTTHVHDMTYGDCICGEVDSVEHWFDISTVEELYEFANIVNQGHKWLNGRLLDDIVLNDTIIHDSLIYDRNRGVFGDSTLCLWIPITYFSGVFDGQNHVIKGLYVEERLENYSLNFCSFIQNLENGMVRNLGMEQCFVFENWEGVVGAICSNSKDSYFENCHASGYVGGVYVNAAGLVGDAQNCTFENCYNLASVYGQSGVSGIANVRSFYKEPIHKMSLNRCWNGGDIRGNNKSANVGGLATSILGRVDISNSYNVGSVSAYRKDGQEGVGGICGGDGSNIHLSDCFNLGTVSADSFCGGLAPLGITKVYMYDAHQDSAKFEEGATYLHNCYMLHNCVLKGNAADSSFEELHLVSAEQFANGEVCYALNHGKTDGTQLFFQNLNEVSLKSSDAVGSDQYPTLDPTHKGVAFDGNVYYNMKPTDVGDESLLNESGICCFVDGLTLSLANYSGHLFLSDVNGRVLFSKVVNLTDGDSIEITLPSAGLYILLVDGRPYKVVAK